MQSVAFRPSHSMCGVNPKAALASHAFLASSCDGVVRERRLEFSDSVDAVGMGPSPAPICPKRMLLANDGRARLEPSVPVRARRAHAARGVVEECYLVDPASSHMLVSKIKPCMCKYELIQTVKLRMAH